jgi:hypothetical protein
VIRQGYGHDGRSGAWPPTIAGAPSYIGHMRRMLLSMLAVAALAAPAVGHHGFTGRYDTDKPYFLVGTVSAISASPPHPTVTIQVAPSAIAPPSSAERPSELTGDVIALDPQFVGRSVAVEFPPVGAFFELGGKLKVGDVVELIALRNCRAPHQLRSQWVRLSDRSVVKREGRLSYMARGCAEG